MNLPVGSEESTILEVIFDDNVCYCIKHKLDVVSVCGTSEVGVDFFLVLAFIEILKLHLYVCGSLFICVGTCRQQRERDEPTMIIMYCKDRKSGIALQKHPHLH